MADHHCFVGTREVGRTRLKPTSSGASSTSNGRNKEASNKSPQRLSDILRMRRLRLNRAKTTTTSSLSDSMSDSASQHHHQVRDNMANRTNSNSLMSSSDLFRNNSTHSYESARSMRSNMTTLTALSSTSSSATRKAGKLKRASKYEEEISDGQLGINEKELNSMNKHIPALRSHGKSATFRQHYYPEGGWGWVITFCCFLVNIFTTGLQLSFSILYLEIIRHCGGEDKADKIGVVWIGATNLALSHFMAPLLVALCKRKSTRLTAVVGGLIMALSLLFTSFARHFQQILLSYGILFGIGCAMVRETSCLMLSQYFKRRREVVEMLSTTGIGFGIAIFSNIYQSGFESLGWRLGLQAVTGATTCLFFLGLFYRSASLYHPQRRAILHLKDMSKRKGKDKNKIDNKPPYFDFATLKNRPFQVILTSLALCCTGIYTPIFFLVPLALDEGLGDDAMLLQTFLGIATSVGSFSFGIIVLSKSQQCLISSQYLLQASIFGIGVSMLALASVEGYHGYLMFVWLYGIFLGGFEFSLRVYAFERLRVRQFPRGWGFVQGTRALPFLIGIPVTAYINRYTGDPKAGFYFSFTCTILGAVLLFLMECFKGGRASTYYGSKMDLCKTDTNMSYEMNGGVVMALGESASDNGQRNSMAGSTNSQNGHLKCTCPPESHVKRELVQSESSSESRPPSKIVPSTISSNKVVFDDDIAAIEVVDPVPDIEEEEEEDEEEEEEEEKVELEGVEEEDEDDEDDDDDGDEDDMIDLAQALFNAGVKPELLTCISEENLLDQMEGDYIANGCLDSGDEDSKELHAKNCLMWSEFECEEPEEHHKGDDELSPIQKRVLLNNGHSFSEPDLVHLMDRFERVGNNNTRLLHPSARPLLHGNLPERLVVHLQQEQFRRQKTWHQFKSLGPVQPSERATAQVTSFV